MSQVIKFPSDFLWGAATAAYQIEGAAKADGRGESIWDRFSHTPGKVTNGDTGDVACDHYHRFSEDIKLMKDLGIQGYRFSVAWPRILPTGKNQINWLGLDFYDRLVDMLLMNNIQPYLTLYHWDLPQALQDNGGWANRDTCGYFADYAAIMARRLGDRVKNWYTINEPWVVAFLGNKTGEMAPGFTDEKLALQISHNLMVAHGKAMQAIRADRPDVKAGIVLSLSSYEPLTDTEQDKHLADYAWRTDGSIFLDALFRGYYDPKLFERYGDKAPQIAPGDMALISQRMDTLGVNHYFRIVLHKDDWVPHVPGAKETDMGWEINGDAFYRLLTKIHKDYDLPPIYITENGAAFKDTVSPDGHVHDAERTQFLQEYIAAVRRAMDDGVDVRGYFVWSLLDNFEWHHGYTKRFGITYVDYATQQRILKDSGRWYANVIKHDGFEIPKVAARV
jgi:beta-glucosidase